MQQKFKGEVIVRVPGDNCLPEPKEIDKIINYHLTQKRRVFSSDPQMFLNQDIQME